MSTKNAKPARALVARAAKKDEDGAQIGRVRRICTALPGVTEKLSHGAPTFFAGKRVFTMFADNHHDDGHVAVWIPAQPGLQEHLIEDAPETFFRPPYVGGAGWVGIELVRIGDEELSSMIRAAWCEVAPKTLKAVAAPPSECHPS